MKKRKTNKHLPSRVYHKHGAYFFVDKNNKWHRLGETLSEAMAKWSREIEPPENVTSMKQLFDRYMLEVAPEKSEDTYRCNRNEIKALYEAFSNVQPENMTAVMIYRYMDKRGKVAPVMANRERSLLSHVFSMAIRWGYVTDNPCKHVKRITEKRRDRYVTHEEFQTIRNLAGENIKNIIDFAYLTGLRQADILKTKLSDLDIEGIHVEIQKTKNKILILWSEPLRQVVNEAKNRAIALSSSYLFPNGKGQKYTTSGFRALWQELMKKAIEQKVVHEKFRFHDLRRKTATEMERVEGRENARKLLGHSDQKTTGIYISGEQKVKPLDSFY